MRAESAQRNGFGRWWGVAWGLVCVIVAVATDGRIGSNTAIVLSSGSIGEPVSDAARFTFLALGCCVCAGGGAFMTLSKVNCSRQGRWVGASVWAAVGLVTAVAIIYLAWHPGPLWLYQTTTIRSGIGGPLAVRTTVHDRSPILVHLALTLPVAGAIGGLVHSFCAVSTASLRDRLGRSVVAVLMWSAAFAVGGIVALYGTYLLGAATTDLFEAGGLSAPAGGMVGKFLGGYMGGYLAGAIGSLVPGTSWRLSS